MNFIKSLKIAVLEPQLNKATKKEAGHREIEAGLKEKQLTKKLGNRERSQLAYSGMMANVHQLEKEKLQAKLEKVRRS